MLLKQILYLLLLSTLCGAFRQFAPHGISWLGKWPTSTTTALESYTMMAKKEDPPFIGLQEVINVQEKKSAVFLDARSTAEFSQGRIPGARNLPYYEMESHQAQALQGLSSDTPIIIYCEGVGCELSFFLGRELKAGGYQNMRIFYGGYPEWKGGGLPIEK